MLDLNERVVLMERNRERFLMQGPTMSRSQASHYLRMASMLAQEMVPPEVQVVFCGEFSLRASWPDGTYNAIWARSVSS